MSQSRKWTVGEPVYIVNSYGWGPAIFIEAVVAKVTPSGIVHTSTGVIFNRDGYERGAKTYRRYLDTTPFAERTKELKAMKRVKQAADDMLLIEPSDYLKKWWDLDKLQLLAEANRLQTLLDNARRMVEEIEP